MRQRQKDSSETIYEARTQEKPQTTMAYWKLVLVGIGIINYASLIYSVSQ